MIKDSFISASEIGEYIYCKRAWWLRYSGLVEGTKELIEGAIQHETLSDQLAKYQPKKQLAWGLIVLGIGIVMIILLFLLLGV